MTLGKLLELYKLQFSYVQRKYNDPCLTEKLAHGHGPIAVSTPPPAMSPTQHLLGTDYETFFSGDTKIKVTSLPFRDLWIRKSDTNTRR